MSLFNGLRGDFVEAFTRAPNAPEARRPLRAILSCGDDTTFRGPRGETISAAILTVVFDPGQSAIGGAVSSPKERSARDHSQPAKRPAGFERPVAPSSPPSRMKWGGRRYRAENRGWFMILDCAQRLSSASRGAGISDGSASLRDAEKNLGYISRRLRVIQFQCRDEVIGSFFWSCPRPSSP
jgi:hypothetical protein